MNISDENLIEYKGSKIRVKKDDLIYVKKLFTFEGEETKFYVFFDNEMCSVKFLSSQGDQNLWIAKEV